MVIDTETDDSGKVSCFQTNLEFILDMLTDECVFGVIVENGIKMSRCTLSKLTDKMAEVSSFEAEPVITEKYLCMYAMKERQRRFANLSTG